MAVTSDGQSLGWLDSGLRGGCGRCQMNYATDIDPNTWPGFCSLLAILVCITFVAWLWLR